MLPYLEPEKRSRVVPTHLRAALLGQSGPENEFDARLIAAIHRAFEPGRILAISEESFSSRIFLYGMTFEGLCSIADVRERY